MKKIYFVLFILISNTPVRAQIERHSVDSIERLLSPKLSDTMRMVLYNGMVKEFLIFDPDSSIYYGNQILRLSKGWEKWIGIGNLAIGNGYLSIHSFKEGMHYLDEAALHAERAKDTITAGKALTNMGSFYNISKNYSKALEIYKKDLPLFQALKDSENVAAILGDIGTIYFNLKDYPHALKFLDSASNLNILINQTLASAENIIHLSQVHFELGNFLLAIEKSKLALEIFDRLGITERQLYARIRYAEVINGSPNSVVIREGIRPNNKFEKALEIAQNALDSAKLDSNFLYLQRDAYFVISKVYENQRKCELALEAYKQIDTLNALMFSKGIENSIAYEKGNFDAELKHVKDSCAISEQTRIDKIANDSKVNLEYVRVFIWLLFAAIVLLILLRFILVKRIIIPPWIVIFLIHLWIVSISELVILKVHSKIISSTKDMPIKTLLVIIPFALYFSFMDQYVERGVKNLFKKKI